MGFKSFVKKVQGRVERARNRMEEGGQAMKSIVDSIPDDFVESAFRRARETIAPSPEHLPVDFQLRQHSLPRRVYERIVPVSHVFRMTYRYGREFLDDFMPISNNTYIGRGSYKFVYSLPWQMVLKISRGILPSDPIIGSMFREVDADQDRFLTQDEMQLQEYLIRGKLLASQKESLRFKFNRLGMERYHYIKVQQALPDLVLPTRYFMGLRFRKRPFGGHSPALTPMDSQIMLVGKHLKEFATAGKKAEQKTIMRKITPRYNFQFDVGRFGRIKKKVLVKITEDFRRLIRFTERLAVEEKLILDIHTENIIITLPDFELKIFDFHIFDEHLYAPSLHHDSPEQDHVEIIEKFIESLDLYSH